MDGAIALTRMNQGAQHVAGLDGGNDRFWNQMTQYTSARSTC